MATTGTTSYNPAASNMTLTAFGRIGIRRTEITAQHMADAEQEANLVQVKLANRQPNLWTSTLLTTTLVAGTATYTLPASTIAIQACYLTTSYSGSPGTDRLIWPYSVFEYSAIPDKTVQGSPTSYWYNRLSTPEISLWPVPDDTADYVLNLRVVSQIEDVSVKSGLNVDMPYRWLDVFVSELAYRLSRIYAPDKEALRKVDAEDAWANAATEDQERVPIFINASIGSYYN